MSPARRKVLTVFGTRPEIIKLAPVITALEGSDAFETVNVTSAQHREILYPFVERFGIRTDYDLQVMESGQTLSDICSRVLARLDPILSDEAPDLVLVQGDTTSALASAMAAVHRRVPVAHVEAGLRSGDRNSPYPEELNRRLITTLATYHFAATVRNRNTLLSEGVSRHAVFVTGNPVVDAVLAERKRRTIDQTIIDLLVATDGFRRLVLTTHRRESLGDPMTRNLEAIRAFVDAHTDVALIFPVHPNPAVVAAATALLGNHARIHLTAPLGYSAFISVLAHAWLIVSDSGGVQEEAPTLGKPLLILRENTERPEAIDAGVARLVGGSARRLAVMLEQVYRDTAWARAVGRARNPFGDGQSGSRIATLIAGLLGVSDLHASELTVTSEH